MNNVKSYLPIILLLAGLVLFFTFDGQKYLSLTIIKQHYNSILIFTNHHFWLSSIVFIITYIIVVAFSIPGATLMTLMGGFLFGLFPGVIWIILSATIGSYLVFLAVKTAFGKSLKEKATGTIEKLRNGFESNAFNYLLTLRLIPIFPFFVINIACGTLNIRSSTFFWATLIGIIPGSLIYAWVGTGLGFALKQGKELNMGIIFEPQFILPIIGLGILSLVPVIYKKVRKA